MNRRKITRAAFAVAAIAAVAAITVAGGCAKNQLEISHNTTVAHADAQCGTVKRGVSVSRYNQSAYSNTSGGNLINELGCGWWYNWSSRPNNAYIDGEFVPMIWGRNNVNDQETEYIKQGAAEGKFTHVLTFNEPDLADQADMTVDEAVELWPQLEEIGLPLSSPAVSGYSATEGNWWLDEFMEKAEENDLRVDFIAIHLYQSFYSQSAADDLMEVLEALYNKYRLPVWLTEFGAIDIISRDSQGSSPNHEVAAECTEANAVKYMQQACRRMEQSGFVERYAWFVDNFNEHGAARPWEAPFTTLYNDDDSISATGSAYKGISSGVALEMVTEKLAEGKAGEWYEQDLEVAGGSGNYLVSVKSLPAGLTLQNGKLCGTPERADYYSIDLNIRDGAGQTLNRRYVLHII